jgi:hypothetical protein
MNYSIRPYRPADRNAIREICADTGFMGEPIDAVFCDRDAFSDFFTRYYTDYEPENCLIAEAEGTVVGYLLGSTQGRRHRRIQILLMIRVVPKMCWRVLSGRYDSKSLGFLWWFLRRAGSETPASPEGGAHFHINLLLRWRNGLPARRLIFSFVDRVRDQGMPHVYGQIQTYETRRPPKVFERYGFRLYDQREITKFRKVYHGKVWVSTVVKELGPHPEENRLRGNRERTSLPVCSYASSAADPRPPSGAGFRAPDWQCPVPINGG